VFTILDGGNIGIGTTSPKAKFAIHQKTNDPHNEYLFAIASSTEGAATTTLMVVTNDGKVGIGTASPSHNLEVVDAGTNSQSQITATTYNDQTSYRPEILLRKSHNDAKGTLTTTIDGEELGGLLFYGVDHDPIFELGAAIIAIQNGAAAATVPTDLYFYTSGNSGTNVAMVVDNNGNVGIGTTSPNALLDVYRDSGGTDPLFKVGTSTTQNILVVKANGKVGIYITD